MSAALQRGIPSMRIAPHPHFEFVGAENAPPQLMLPPS